ncbi:beta-glucosidase 12-like [Cucurbita pepo subsp. pepo]|uniref:beta-glucosidase 12-like n=1 Tax=Cucurbita pepo subsp. pepo TaxID=3664 RepID=UPI000C9D2C7F|nr:beta-glucosidase 12-like [Cucurbita pepo subsp. pepo]XP_023530953.1 beta-glucosidase 12-like [Cucurbita pepo subsp. pepo]
MGKLVLLVLLVLRVLVLVRASGNPSHGVEFTLNRSCFPQGFVFGTASSAYQYEGAANTDGRGPSIWDTFTHKYPGKIKDGSSGDIANDAYHRYKEDVGIMKKMNLDAYRFSISWSRILPKGKLSGGVNHKGIQYYNNLINELLAKGIEPYITLFHWDLPQALEDEYGGFLSPRIVDDFKDYAEVCFKEFGDRVKHWISLNEPWSYSMGGYALGILAPSRCSWWQNLSCSGGDAATEPYRVAHYQILAHAAAVELYREKYQKSQKGLIGITLVSHWFVPVSNARKQRKAAYRALDFMLGWFMNPLTFGDYPKSMKSLVGKRLPNFTKEQSELVKGSFDFLGFNYYTTNYAQYTPPPNANRATYFSDARTILSTKRNGVPIGPIAASPWLAVYPRGIHDALLYIKAKYNNPVIYITENGVDEFNNATLSLKEALIDNFRIDYHRAHLYFLHKAIEGGSRVKGYFAWSLLDNFEWADGYTVRFGINFVDYKDGMKRYPKTSAHWFETFLKR